MFWKLHAVTLRLVSAVLNDNLSLTTYKSYNLSMLLILRALVRYYTNKNIFTGSTPACPLSPSPFPFSTPSLFIALEPFSTSDFCSILEAHSIYARWNFQCFPLYHYVQIVIVCYIGSIQWPCSLCDLVMALNKSSYCYCRIAKSSRGIQATSSFCLDFCVARSIDNFNFRCDVFAEFFLTNPCALWVCEEDK